ncbi:MAG TPA: branched-chain amino acid ABC transporter ATP-binding protein/permease [Burkholderiales bacterium]|nr:branched-chain amino acid ABC transporter ATP-binding protein/permease [Burkholderiales bacterium]
MKVGAEVSGSNLRRQALVIAAFGIVFAVATAFAENSYYQLIMTLVPVWAVMGLAWNILSGYSGFVSFGHAAFFGLGAYAVALAQIHWGVSPWLGIPLAGAVGALAALVVGFPTFRLRGHYFALAMLAYPLALLYVFEWLGYQELTLPMQREAPLAAMQFEDHRIYAWLALALMIGAMVLTGKLERSRFGMSLLAIKQDEAAAEAAGIRTLAWKLKAITLSGAMAGTIGGFYAVVLLVVTPPAVFGMLVSAQALIVAMFGGVGTLWGPVIGAVILVPLSELLHAKLGNVIPGIQGVVYGIAIVAVILLAPEGIFWKVKDLLLRAGSGKHRAPPQPAGPASAAVAELPLRNKSSDGTAVFEVRNVSKAFGGLQAVRDISLKVVNGEILGIIGPNGAGKTTFFNLLNGFIRPDAGRILLEERDIVGARPYQICAAGVGRTFQVVRPFRRMTVLENVVVGAYVHAATDREAHANAEAALAQVGLEHDAQLLAGVLSNKQLRLLELARALAGKPKVLLLDETLAGLGGNEVEEVMALVRKLAARGLTIVIIEHTMGAMVRLVDRFVVLNDGAVLAEGNPADITRNPAVIDAYLGKRWRLASA